VRFGVLTASEREPDRTSPEWKARETLISRAKVFHPNPGGQDAADPNLAAEEVVCHYVLKPAKATTPKFDCRLENGDVVKVKYGRSRERQGEAAATRLLATLGFGADRVEIMRRVRCHGCPPWPFQLRILAEQFLLVPLFERAVALAGVREFEWVAVERKLAGRAIEVDGFEGWDWRELDLLEPGKGGATRAELDALRLVAVLLGHWDNKAPNQRLVCLGPEKGHDPDAPCDVPLLMLQDVGATFGPTKVNYEAWSALPIWKDAATCTVSMETMPYEGILFPPVQISEGGRRLLAGRLRTLSRAEVQALFERAHFPRPVIDGKQAEDVLPWVDAFEAKIRQIADRAPCPLFP